MTQRPAYCEGRAVSAHGCYLNLNLCAAGVSIILPDPKGNGRSRLFIQCLLSFSIWPSTPHNIPRLTLHLIGGRRAPSAHAGASHEAHV